ncbi:WYL domain-containing protein [Pseudokineococcus marinus]|uniref:WYL domain-containing protein n=1 Tax=Pseudokineococcus marinus TaxID=351215 RepID=A0A849BQP0_9ACTN|nr:WYL domain-containing protein [Pseudokineococcus marinus]NNH22834.1 WYL domain-containing protein [Pseudokineococcus marinus]
MSGTPGRLLTLLSLLQARRDWPGSLLAERLEVSPRTVRRDVDRLRELGYPVRSTTGPDGGYRLGAGADLPPLLFDDEQAVALAVALQLATANGVGGGDAAERALATVRQVLPARLRARVDAVRVTPLATGAAPVDEAVLLAVTAAVRAREVLRFDYASPSDPADAEPRPPRRVEPHAVVARGGRWYLLGWDPAAPARGGAGTGDWRTHRLDRMTPRTPTGPRFTPREVPGGDPAAFVAALFRGSHDPGGSGAWPCEGRVVVHAPATEVAPYLADGAVEALDDDRCRITAGAWSWTGLAASLLRLGADVEVERPSELARAFAELAERCARAGGRPPPTGRTEQRPRGRPSP